MLEVKLEIRCNYNYSWLTVLKTNNLCMKRLSSRVQNHFTFTLKWSDLSEITLWPIWSEVKWFQFSKKWSEVKWSENKSLYGNSKWSEVTFTSQNFEVKWSEVSSKKVTSLHFKVKKVKKKWFWTAKNHFKMKWSEFFSSVK